MQKLIDEIITFSAGRTKDNGVFATEYPGLGVLVETDPSRLESMVYDPVICLILQGAKETHIGDRCVQFGAGDSIIVTHTVPVVAAITEASKSTPYVAMIMTINIDMVRSFYDDLGTMAENGLPPHSLEAAPTDDRLIEAMARTFRASQNPRELQALAPLYMREAHFHMLEASHGSMLRQLLWRDSAASRVGRVIATMRADFAKPVRVAELAESANMSVSTFHDHFKALTATSPLKFQKELRLTEARRMLSIDGRSVSETAFAIGYESPTQFSREYSRKFGVPPRSHMLQRSAA